jgi:RNA polymerase sigma-32 factor
MSKTDLDSNSKDPHPHETDSVLDIEVLPAEGTVESVDATRDVESEGGEPEIIPELVPELMPELVDVPKRSKRLVKKRAVGVQKPKSVSLTETDPILQAYLREVQRYPLLTREEERQIAEEFYQTGSRESLQRLVTSNLRFVVKIAFEYIHYRMKLLDLIQEGNMGLVKAVKEFNPYREVRLTTYAVWWIRSYIQDAILKNYSLVKMGTTQAQKKLFYRLRAEQKKLEQMGISASEKVALLASTLDVREKDIREMDQRLGASDLSLNAPIQEGEKNENIQMLADSAAAVDDSLGDSEQRELFHRILTQFAATLEGRDKSIFEDRLISENPATLQEIGDKYGVTKERARQLEENIKKRLKEYMQAHYPDFNILAGSQ